MRLIASLTTLASALLLSGCFHKGPNPDDPYESLNRKIYRFNNAFDATILKPPARLYKAVLPDPVRASINNAYNNINMIPTVANDVLQWEWRYAIKDTWRFVVNSTFGIGGLFDVADKRFGLPPHSNDLGLTFAKWGDKKSPFIMIPLMGPSTIRDGMGMLFEYTVITPYPYIGNDAVIYGLIGLRYVDLRSQLFETERLMSEALDPYAFLRDAYLQHRHYRITGQQGAALAANGDDSNDGSDYVDDEGSDENLGTDYVDEDEA
ncbi:VacJ family lipoprotein [Legionella taurinensis]|uniref:ABC transporter n=1 Tax=Legionella taurinensis TaxID=70611 RepID=A0A3A5LLF3_9GAMM|nr:VacJ family lipoprotein [Legionella taurinensis]MDX1836468.1 VacJ family lipoprotein [Legionella taurinensis]PUT43060.1 ABC transporter [Legionella taurinensis]PUT45122.1 ABC transporter [Legionella taurinensis]PUT45615.1 ABC transporter [Legionella taurinensis]PUT49384.1 ABC transporter [Legionella taurinensis]